MDSPLKPIENVSLAPKGNKRLSVERIYQKKSQLEHILLRPDTYIGSVEKVTQAMWVYDKNDGMVNREITFVPGLYKIFDEILVNAADNKQRDQKMNAIKIKIDPEANQISVWNNGKGIPVVEHKDEKMFVPEMIFGHLLTSSNYDDSERKVTGGRNGYGAKLCNIFSTKFSVETSSKEYGKSFKMTWTGNMAKSGEKKLASAKSSDFTCITFSPDLKKFGMDSLDDDTVALLSRRAYDIAGTSKGVNVYLNGEKLPVRDFKDYVQLYTSKQQDENGDPFKVIHEQVNPRWEVCLTTSDKGFQQLSFVNSIATTKGGRHTDYVMDQIVKKLIEIIKRKNKGGVAVKPFQIKNHCSVFINCLVENPTFDSQTKENMTLQAKKFGSKCEMTEKFLKAASNSGIVDNILNWVKFKAQSQLQKKGGNKSSKLKGIPKLDDANDAGTKNSSDCTLILTEGDSAKTLAVSGLSVVGRDKFGVFPLRGKLLNVRDANHKQVMENVEINHLIKIMGLQYKKKYDNEADVKSLRYGKIMIMTDQDHDGSHIKGLLINFVHTNWPNLLNTRVMEEFITPIVKVSKGSQVLSFYSIPEFEEWEKDTPNSKTWRVKYYKGLGTSTAKEAKEYFADMRRHRIPFKYIGPEDDECIDMAFNKKRADDRKTWLRTFMDNKRDRMAEGLPEDILYNQSLKSLSYSEFVNKELVLFSIADLERSVPSLIDGLKTGQRKVLYTCFKRNDKREVKVAQLAGSIAEISAYHHGEVSLMGTIINMAQNFVGSNNINLLQPIGQFGTRLHGGKDSASPRYIFTMLSPLARLLFPPVDDNLLSWVFDDNQKVEPEWYCPIIPMVLVNGAEGIGTGWSTKIPNHDPREVIENCKRYIRGEELLPLHPTYKNFKGTLTKVGENKYICNGVASLLDDCNLEISELPVKTWTQAYKENILEPMVLGTEKTPPQIVEYREYNTDLTVKFQVKIAPEKLCTIEQSGLHKFFSIQTSLTFNNTLVVFDEYGALKKFDAVLDILNHFCKIRSKKYIERKEFVLGMLTAETKKLENQARLIVEQNDGLISILNRKKKDLIQLLIERGYNSDPVKAWKETLNRSIADDPNPRNQVDEEEVEDSKADFNYILNMPFWSLSIERMEDLLATRDRKRKELEELSRKTPNQLWMDDLEKLEVELEKVEEKEKQDMASECKPKKLQKGGLKGRIHKVHETKPSPKGILIDPKISEHLYDANKVVKKRKTKKDDSSVKKLDEYFDKEDIKLVIKTEKSEAKKAEIKKPGNLDTFVSLSDRLKSSGKKLSKNTKQSKLNFKPQKKKDPWATSSEDEAEEDITDLDDVDDGDIVDDSPVKLKQKKTTDLLDFDSDDSTASKTKTTTKKTSTTVATKRKKLQDSDDEPPKKINKTKKTTARSKKKIDWSESEEEVVISDEDDEEVMIIEEPKAVAKPVKKKNTKPAPKKNTAAPKKTAKSKIAWLDSSDGDEGSASDPDIDLSEDEVPRRTTSKRTVAPKKYTFDDSEDDDDDDNDDY